MDFSFLNDVTLEAVQESTITANSKTPALPEGECLRLFKNGRIYPSNELLAKYDLQFLDKVEVPEIMTGDIVTKIPGNGIDFVGSKDWTMIKDLTEPVMFIAFIPREGNTKIDLWGSSKYNESGEPKSDVGTQGVATFAKNRLVDMVAEYFQINWEETEYVDLRVVSDIPMVSPNGVYHLPKVISRGKDAGKASYARRENIEIFPLDILREGSENTSKEPITEDAPKVIEENYIGPDAVSNISVESLL